MKINWKQLIISILISVGVGALAGILTRNSMDVYSMFNKPPLAPPGWLFPIVWTILYVLMGISAYLVYSADVLQEDKEKALSVYSFQLFFNFLWSIVFFNFQARLLSFIILIILWVLIIMMIILFNKVSKVAAKLQIPYLLWVTFAGYLNFMVYYLNR